MQITAITKEKSKCANYTLQITITQRSRFTQHPKYICVRIVANRLSAAVHTVAVFSAYVKWISKQNVTLNRYCYCPQINPSSTPSCVYGWVCVCVSCMCTVHVSVARQAINNPLLLHCTREFFFWHPKTFNTILYT